MLICRYKTITRNNLTVLQFIYTLSGNVKLSVDFLVAISSFPDIWKFGYFSFCVHPLFQEYCDTILSILLVLRNFVKAEC